MQKIARTLRRRLIVGLRKPLFLFLALSACGLTRCAPPPLDSDEISRRYADALQPATEPLTVYHIGHSLVGYDMPRLLAELAGTGHTHASQLGSYAELESHWDPDLPLRGGDRANDRPDFREAHDAVGSGDYDAIVLTERVDIRDSVRKHESWRYLSLWAQKAWAANPDVRVYLYETWGTRLNADWADRLETDLPRYWEREILDRAMADEGTIGTIYVIPAGQVFAEIERRLIQGPIGRVTTTEMFFRDHIHLDDLGNYLVALIHYAVLYGRSPVGLPHKLQGFKTVPDALDADTARRLQEIVWQVVTNYPRTGVVP